MDSGYTVVGIIEDGAELNQAVTNLQEFGINGENLTVILKRKEPDEPEPFPPGTRYIVIPDDARGLELAVGVAVVFVISALLFAFTTPQIGIALFVFFITLAAILAVGAFTRVGVDPILIDLEVPAEDSGVWNDEFEVGKVLVFASTDERRDVRPILQILRGQGADSYVVGRRLEPQPVGYAMLHRAGSGIEEDLPAVAEKSGGG